MNQYIKKSVWGLSLVALLSGCEVLEQEPQSFLTTESAISDGTTAQAALLGAYNAIQSNNYYGTRMVLLPDLAAGNLNHTGTFPSFAQIFNRTILADNVEVANAWNVIYDGVNRANNIIARVPDLTDPTLAQATKDGYVAEAQFLRAFHYFNLVRTWGGVPLVLQPTTVAANLQVPRSTAAQVYAQIEQDLDAAIAKLPATYSGTLANKGRATRAAAQALKAKVALYQRKWAEANTLAQQASAGFSLVPVFQNIFEQKNTAEAIWELQFDPTNQNSMAFFLLPTNRGGRNEARPAPDLVRAFPAGDSRAILATSVDPRLKYYRVATGDDNVVLLRLGEMLLIRAEALVELGGDANLTEAARLVDQVRARAGLTPLTDAVKVSQMRLRDEVFQQRRLELALEGGNYWYDLIRTGRAATVLPNWNPNQALWPIPFREINANPQLQQNPGY